MRLYYWRQGAELALIIPYQTSASEIIIIFKLTKKLYFDSMIHFLPAKHIPWLWQAKILSIVLFCFVMRTSAMKFSIIHLFCSIHVLQFVCIILACGMS